MRVYRSGVFVSLSIIVLLLTAPAAFAVVYDEGVNADLSSNPNAPTALGIFGVGTHSVTGTSSGGEQDDYSFTILPGTSLTQLINFSYNSPLGDNTAFIGMASGATIPNQGLAPGNLMGYTHFGPNIGTVGTDILDDIGAAGDAIGFTPPVGPGTYSIWSQQAGNPATWRMDFVVVPEPASLGLLAFSALLLRRGRIARV